MLIDCDNCRVRGAACGECLLSAVVGAPPEGVEVDPEQLRAMVVLADAGLLPKLRLRTVAGAQGRAGPAESADPAAPDPLPGTGVPAEVPAAPPARWWAEPRARRDPRGRAERGPGERGPGERGPGERGPGEPPGPAQRVRRVA